MPRPKTPPLSLAELQASREYLTCSAKMQVWLTALVTNGFKYTDATVAAFDCKDRESARVFSYAVRNWPKIRAALNLYLGKSEREILLDKVRAALRHTEAGGIAEQRLLAQEERLLFGGTTPAEDDETPKPKATAMGSPSDVQIFPPQEVVLTVPARYQVGDIVPQKGVKYRITAVDENGQPTAADPVE
jgi:hypothetical protein